MSSLLDMSLDDLIRKSKEHGGHDSISRSRGTGSGSILGPGPDRWVVRRNLTRPKPYSVRPAWVMEVQQEPIMLAASEGSNGEAKLYVSNLDYGVSNEDIKVLFSEVGELLRYSLHYDMSGRSKGTAEVVFARQIDALAAIKRYNNVQLDGKPLKIELVGVNIITPVPVPVISTTNLAKPNGSVRRPYLALWASRCKFYKHGPPMEIPHPVHGLFLDDVSEGKRKFRSAKQWHDVIALAIFASLHGNLHFGVFHCVHERIGARGRGHGGSSGNGSSVQEFARGHGQGRHRVEKLTAESLDSDLDRYHFEAMKLK
ncbi:unnamed protein product [Dovyalis caffra]|uniref:RRM domain-containing protein n=1 Tax=Dovyalis caffra TaxID=77055 RepID=A0AAV1QV44_9ROSI|nr:unnamed protein product [Dovyalis caffra]